MNESEVSIRFNNEIKNQNKLKEYVEQLKTIKAFAGALDNKTIADVNVATASIKNMQSKLSTGFNYTAIREFTRHLTNVTKTMSSFVTKTSDYLENINLFQVAFDGNYKSADRFIKKMSEMYGLDESWLTRTVGIFRQLSNAMNLSAENGERLSTLMAQMSLDISSLYNIDVDKASSVLQSAIAGQTKPIRGATGADITQATLQTTLDNLGIDRAINQLSYAEKRLVIIISLTQQLNESIGDMGRTIESPANQTRVLKEQWERLTRTVGSAFLPILAKILPYLNAILMALTEIVSLIAGVFGFKIEDYDYFSGMSDSVLDLEDSLKGATSGAKALKSALAGLRVFDRLNVIRTPSTGGGGGAGGGVGGTGISGDILKAFNKAYDEYQKKLEKIRMKASDIKDSIMRTLGFHKELNKETGEWEWKYDGVLATIKGLWNAFMRLNPKAKVFATILATIIGSKVIKGVKTLVTLFGNTKLGKVVGATTSSFKTLWDSIKVFKNAGGTIANGIDFWSSTMPKLEMFSNILLGTGGVVAGLNLTRDAAKRASEEGNSFGKVMEGVGGTLLSVFGGALAGGSVGGAYGAAAGAILGLATSVTGAIVGMQTALSETELQLKDISDKNLERQKEWMEAETTRRKVIGENSEEMNYYQSLYDELTTIVDENGKIKKGYEDRAEVIVNQLNSALGTNIKIVDNEVKGYENLGTEIDKVIAKKKAEAQINALYPEYELAIKNVDAAEQDYGKTLDLSKKKHQEYYDAVKSGLEEWADKYEVDGQRVENILDHIEKTGDTTWESWSENMEGLDKNTQKALKNVFDNLDQLRSDTDATDAQLVQSGQTYKKYADTINTYTKIVTLAEQGKYEAINEFMELERGAYGKSAEEQVKYYNNKILVAQRGLKELEQNRSNMSKEEYDKQYKHYNDMIDLLTTKMNEEKIAAINGAKDIDDEIVKIFYDMGNKSTDEFTKKISGLPEEVQKKIVDKIYAKGQGISKELQKGLDSVNISKTVTIKGDTSAMKESLNKVLGSGSKIGDALRKIGINIPTKFASGGLPQVGQLFVANERGPELVGHIGGQSFVANQNQMMDLLDKKISSPKASNTNQVFNIYLDENHKIGTYTLEQLQGMAKTNGKPITIS